MLVPFSFVQEMVASKELTNILCVRREAALGISLSDVWTTRTWASKPRLKSETDYVRFRYCRSPVSFPCPPTIWSQHLPRPILTRGPFDAG